MLKQIGNYLENKWSLRLLTGFYFIAGLNHFINPEFYIPLIPAFFENPEKINILSGIAEIILAIGVFFYPSRKTASYLIIAMLLAFIPSHVYFIQLGSCIEIGLCVPEWIGWFRLLIIHPALLFWAWKSGKSSSVLY
ncbi:DoxX family protein [Marivirga sp.]|uniref:DoxX family protein n=1 Tax=Marivirga sp. TaxID=2018662 RepID=UPI003DA782FB